MRTLQVFNVYQHYGGEEGVVRTLSRLMAGEDWRDLFFESREWAEEGLAGRLTQPVRTFWNAAAVRRLREAQAEHRADVWLLHNVLPVGSLGVYREAALLGMPVIQYLHNYRPFSPGGLAWHGGRVMEAGFERRFGPEILAGSYRGSRWQTAFMALVLQAYFRTGAFEAVTMWLSQTAFQKARYVAAGVKPEAIEVLLPPRELGPGPRPGEGSEEGGLLFLGRLVPEKGVRFLLEQWERARDGRGPALPRLVIAGTGPLEGEVRARVERLPGVSYVGQVGEEERRRLLERCLAVVVPSEWWEVLGLVVFEAYEMEKPVLAARTGGLGEIVFPGRTGFQFEPGDAAGFEAALGALRERGSEGRRAMGRAGREWLREATDPARWRVRYEELAGRAVRRKAEERAPGTGAGWSKSELWREAARS